MKTFRRATASIVFVGLELLAPAFPSNAAPRWPPFIEKVLADSIRQCKGRYVQDQGFVRRKDVNGDGVKDYLVDYYKFACKDDNDKRDPSYWCGSAGCEYDIFASSHGRFVMTRIPNAVAVDFARRRGAYVVDFYVKAGPQAEKDTWRWDGRNFSPVGK